MFSFFLKAKFIDSHVKIMLASFLREKIVIKENIWRKGCVNINTHDFKKSLILSNGENDFYNLIINQVNDIIVILHCNGQCQYVSPSVKKILGYSVNDIIGHSIYEILHPDHIRSVRKLYRDAMDGMSLGKTRFEFQFCRKDGSYIWLQNEVTRICNDAGKCVKTLVVARDITAQKEIEAMQEEKEKRLQYFQESTAVIGMIIDEEGRLIEMYGQNGNLVEGRAKDRRGLMLHQVLPVKEAKLIVKKIQTAIETGHVQHSIYTLKINGITRLIEGRSIPLDYLINGKRTVASVIRDITDKQKIQKKLELTLLIKRNTDFFYEFINKSKVDASIFAAVERMNLNFWTPIFCCIVHVNDGQGVQHKSNLDFTVIGKLSRDPDIFIWNCHGAIGIIFQCNLYKEPTVVGEWIMEEILACDKKIQVKIGIGGTYSGFDGIKKSYQQAKSAGIVACSEAIENKICHFEQIGIYQFLEHFSNAGEAKEFVQRHISRLITYDQEKGTDLLCTLEKILKNVHLKDVANELYLHYNTIIFRKRRIEELLNVSIDDYETRLTLSTAMKLYRLIGYKYEMD